MTAHAPQSGIINPHAPFETNTIVGSVSITENLAVTGTLKVTGATTLGATTLGATTGATLALSGGIGIQGKAVPAQPAAVVVPAFVTGTFGLSTEAKMKELVEAVEKLSALVKSYGFSA